ncbi:phage tail tape measure protein [Cupriavidus nantongensis]|uniref:Phage tail tape measure protein domain-containing protein n=1 Tax=Cupriavidus nantongensis TaxID=1796606 RepID=A0A142JGT1_9BURK|nr:phage tail tape measure protein [Cupriavidus nantongensis]AMR77293.1 hypothetical protein A2G96_05855 [Cupriavidus nantongensis]
MASERELKLKVVLDTIDRATAPLRKISATSAETARALKATRDRLKSLNEQQRVVDDFSSTRGALKQTAADLSTAQQRVRQLAQQLDAAGVPTRALQREFQAAQRDAKTLAMQHDSQAIKLQGLRDKLSAAGISTSDLASHQRQLRSSIASATQQMEAQKQQAAALAVKHRKWAAATRQYQDTQQIASRTAAAGAATTGAGAALGLPVVKVVRDFSSLETATTDLHASMMDKGGKVGAEFDNIRLRAKQLGDKLPGTTRDFMEAAEALVSQGMDHKSIANGGLDASAYLAVLLKLDKARSAEFIAKAREAHGLKDEQLPLAADMIQRARYGFGLKVDDIYESMKYASTDINIKGQVGDIGKMREYMALQGMAAQVGLEGSSFGTNFSHMLKAMASLGNKLEGAKSEEGKYVNSLLEGKGVELQFFNSKGEFAGFKHMMQELEKLRVFTPQEQERILKKMFDTEGGRPASIFLQRGVAGFEEALKRMEDQASLQQRVDDVLGTLKNRWDALGGTATNLSTTLGETLRPQLVDVMDTAGRVIERTTAWVERNPILAGTLVKIAAALAIVLTVMGTFTIALAALIGPFAILRYGMALVGLNGGILATVLGGLGAVLRGFAGLLFGPVAKAIGLVGNVLLWLGRALMLNPIGLVVTGIAAGAYLIWSNWETLGPRFAALWASIQGFTASAWGQVVATLGGMWAQIQAATAGGIGKVSALILDWSPLGLFYRAFAGVLSWFGIELPSRFSEFGANIIRGLANGITGALGSVKAAISGAADAAMTWFREKLGIRSPSRVFAGYGGDISEGTALGIARNEALPANAARRMAAAVATAGALAPLSVAAGQPPQAIPSPSVPAASQRPALAALAPLAARIDLPAFTAPEPIKADTRPPIVPRQQRAVVVDSHDTVQINLHFAAGADEQAITQAIRAELDRREREKATRLRSQMADYHH